MRFIFAALVGTFAVLAVAVVGIFILPVLGAVHAAAPVELVPCQTEEADYDCIWDASEQGNGQGSDFIVLNGVTFYPER